MVESVRGFVGDSEAETDRLKQYVVETAEDYGFTVDFDRAADYPGFIAPEEDRLEVNPAYVEENALTYLWPGLMEEKIEARLSFLRGTYEDDSFGPVELEEKARIAHQLEDARREKVDRKMDNISSRDALALEENVELSEEIELIDRKLKILAQGETSQANLYMVNDLSRDPVETIAVNAYVPEMFELDETELRGYFHEYFEQFPWLNDDAREDVIEHVQDINSELERRAEEFAF